VTLAKLAVEVTSATVTEAKEVVREAEVTLAKDEAEVTLASVLVTLTLVSEIVFVAVVEPERVTDERRVEFI